MSLIYLSPTTIAFVIGVAFLVTLFVRSLYPKPIPGIPYNEEAANSLFGDIPKLLQVTKKEGGPFDWITSLFNRHNSNIIQVFARPFSQPWVLIANHQEAHDILLRRTKELDRSVFFKNLFFSIAKEGHGQFATDHPRFRAQRNLIRDTMNSNFLNEVAGPGLYASTLNMVKLWSTKARVANGHPFRANEDIDELMLDAITNATFGLDKEDSIIEKQTAHVKHGAKLVVDGDIDKPAEIEHASLPPWSQAIIDITNSQEIIVNSPFPRLHHWLFQQTPAWRKAYALKERQIGKQMDLAVQRLQKGDHNEKSALDNILRREQVLAKKEGRIPDYRSRVIYDELMTFLAAGYDTTSTTMKWGFKYLIANQKAQSRLRAELRKTFTAAAAESRDPTIDEIVKSNIPYVDATVEEIVRTAQTIPWVFREATADTTVLGFHIPKGTSVALLATGPGIVDPPVTNSAVKTELTNPSANYSTGTWDPSDITSFKPERWLKPISRSSSPSLDDANGDGRTHEATEVFDPQAGPVLTFGLGVRGCFGRRLAYLDMRIMLVLVIWNFELLDIPDELDLWTYKAKLTKAPNHFYVRLRDIGSHAN